MDQIKIGSFLKELRRERNLTQESLAEKLGVSSRTVSRWETGSNMPDISTLVEIAQFYDVGIPEIINAERKSENMEKEVRETAAAMAEYGKNEVKKGKRKTVGVALTAFGLFVITSALAMFPSESSWGSIYSILGGIFTVVGVWLILRCVTAKRSVRVLAAAGCALALFAAFTVSDYVAVKHFHQVPRFRYETIYESDDPDAIVHKTLFFTVVQKNPGTENEEVYIMK